MRVLPFSLKVIAATDNPSSAPSNEPLPDCTRCPKSLVCKLQELDATNPLALTVLERVIRLADEE